MRACSWRSSDSWWPRTSTARGGRAARSRATVVRLEAVPPPLHARPMTADDRVRGRGRVALAAVAIAGCVGPRGTAPLPVAGHRDDDGAGQLAQASVQIRLGEGVTDAELERERLRGAAARRYARG